MASPRETLCTVSVRVRDDGGLSGTWKQNQANKESSEQTLKGENRDTNRAFSTRQKFSVTQPTDKVKKSARWPDASARQRGKRGTTVN